MSVRKLAHCPAALLVLLGGLAILDLGGGGGGCRLAEARTTYRLGATAAAGYDSAMSSVRPAGTAEQAAAPIGGLHFMVSPDVLLRTETGRIDVQAVYRFLFQGLIPLFPPSFAPSYQNALDLRARIDLTPRLIWTLIAGGSQGRTSSLNYGTNPTDPSTRDLLTAIIVDTEFISVGASSLLEWTPTGRLRLGLSLTERSFIPYGTIGRQELGDAGKDQVAVTPLFQSHTLEGGGLLEYEWARVRLGAHAQVGWFHPQRGLGGANAPGFLIGRAQARASMQLTPRWLLDLQAGVFLATQEGGLLRGRYLLLDESGNLREAVGTVATPVGGLLLSYELPKVDATLALTYQYDGMGEVRIGRLTLSHAVSLRARVPLSLRLGLSGSAGYRYAEVRSGANLSDTEFRVNPDTGWDEAVSVGPTYQLFLCDAVLSFAVRDGVALHLRYSYNHQEVHGQQPLPEAPLGLADFDRHLLLFGVSLYYPAQ